MREVKMKASKVYLRAAMRIDDRLCRRSCWAINEAQGKPSFWVDTLLSRRYVETILGTDETVKLNWPAGADSVDARDVRVLALLFMHQIAKDEERAK